MPPHKPDILSVFLGKITRNLSFDKYKSAHREKRGGGNIDAVLDELEECVSGTEDIEGSYEEKELQEEINRFLLSLPENKRYMFILRYWYAKDVYDIAHQMETTENNVYASLSRIRAGLKKHLNERGFEL